jgi:tetratricopeptide (TPR) repeat protein
MNEESKLVPFARARRRPDRRRVAEFAATARKLQEERAAAEVVVSRVLKERPAAEWTAAPELRNVGAVERLGKEVEARLDREPREALAIAEAATQIAEALRADAYPAVTLAQTRAHAWKDRGQALCYLARHQEALAALETADALLEAFGTLAHDLAIVRFVKSATLQEVNRFEESLQLLGECRLVFRAHGDSRRQLLCGIAEGVLLQRMKRFRDSHETLVALLEIADELHEREYAASIHHNIGCGCIELGEFQNAERHLTAAIEIFRELSQPVRVALTEFARGRLLTRRGELCGGIAHLHRTRADLLGRGIVEEAGIAGLEIVEALLAAGRPTEAESLARDIIREFSAGQLNTRAITALGYLQEAIAARKATATTVDHVRQYIRALRKEPERLFARAEG